MTALNLIERTPTRQLTAPEKQKPEKPKRIPKKVVQAVELLVTGECTTQKAAAERVGLSAPWLCKMLAKDNVRVLIERRARQTLATGMLRASGRVIELMHAGSEHVSLDASKHVLAIAGIKPTADAALSVNIDIKAGYVIDISDAVAAHQREIEAKPLIEHTSGSDPNVD